jgi:2',3'-cyclic-nucleotide 2'-phosphodiesterase (5'-nucleotidase family)
VADIADEMPQSDYGELAIGDLIADGMRAAGHADLAAMNHGGIRTGLHRGPATYASLFEIQPFVNRLMSIRARGSAMRAYFERMVDSRFPGAFISGATAVVDSLRPRGSRVRSITLASGRPLDDTATYTIVINDFMLLGGDALGFTDPLAPATDVGLDLDATIAHLRSLPSPVHAPSPTRWTFLP